MRWLALVGCIGLSACQACSQVDGVTQGNFPCSRDAGAGDLTDGGRQCPMGFRCGFDNRCYGPDSVSETTRCEENADCGPDHLCGATIDGLRLCRSTLDGGNWPCLLDSDCFSGYRCDTLRTRCFASTDSVGPGQALTVTAQPRLSLPAPVLVATTLDDGPRTTALVFDGGTGVLLIQGTEPSLAVVPFVLPNGASPISVVATRQSALLGLAGGRTLRVNIDGGVQLAGLGTGLLAPCSGNAWRGLFVSDTGQSSRTLFDDGFDAGSPTFSVPMESLGCADETAFGVTANGEILPSATRIPVCRDVGRIFLRPIQQNGFNLAVECTTTPSQLVFFRGGRNGGPEVLPNTTARAQACPDGGVPIQVQIGEAPIGRHEAFVQCGLKDSDRYRLEKSFDSAPGLSRFILSPAPEVPEVWRNATAAMPIADQRVHAGANGRVISVGLDGGVRSLVPSDRLRAVVATVDGGLFVADSDQLYQATASGLFIEATPLGDLPIGDVAPAVPSADSGIASLVLTRRGVVRVLATSNGIEVSPLARVPLTDPDLRAPARAMVFDSTVAKWILVIQRDTLFVANVLGALADPPTQLFAPLEPRIAPVPGAPLLSIVTVRRAAPDGGFLSGAQAYANTAAQVVRLESTTFDRWVTRPIELPAGAIEPVKVWVEPLREENGLPRQNDRPRVGLRNGQIYSLPVAVPLSEPLGLNGGVSDFAQVCTTTLAVGPSGLFRLTPNTGGLARWEPLDAGQNDSLANARFLSSGNSIFLSTTTGNLTRIDSAEPCRP